VISLLANLDARTQSSPVWQEDVTSTPQITLGSSHQHDTLNGTLSGLPAASLQICNPATGSGHLTTDTIQESVSVI
jgi:hypothetical protein